MGSPSGRRGRPQWHQHKAHALQILHVLLQEGQAQLLQPRLLTSTRRGHIQGLTACGGLSAPRPCLRAMAPLREWILRKALPTVNHQGWRNEGRCKGRSQGRNPGVLSLTCPSGGPQVSGGPCSQAAGSKSRAVAQ